MYKYEEISRDIETLVRNGALQVGEKVPSVRRISNQYGVSVSTVLSAYTDLERKGFIQSRERSGYFARLPASRRSDLPETPKNIRLSNDISSAHLIRKFCETSRNITPPQFGAAIPDPALMPLAALKRKITQATRRKADSIDTYDFSQGPMSLRREIAKLYFERGLAVDPEDIIITNGCLEAMILSLKSLVPPGSTVMVETPTYFCFLEILKFHGYKVCEVPADTSTGIDLDCLEESIIKCGVKAGILIPSFQNPTGACMPDANREKAVALFARHNIPVIEDDIYGELSFSEANPKPLKCFDSKDLVLTCSSFSKTLSTGLRVGWIISRQFKERILDSKAIHLISAPLINAYAVANYLVEENFSRHIFKLKRAFEYQMQSVSEQVLASFPEGTKLSNPQGGFFLWVQLPDKVDTEIAFQELLADGITIAPGSMFSAESRYKNFMRLSCGFPDSPESNRAIWQIAEAIKKQL